MKKIMFLILAAMLLCTFVSCENNTSDKGKQGALVVEGQTIAKHTTIYPEYATLPLCDVISALGFDLSPDGKDRAYFLCNDVKYEICISEKTLTREGSNENYLICAPGSSHYVCDIANGDLVVDSNTLHSLFYTFLNYPIDITIDGKNSCVTVKVRSQ